MRQVGSADGLMSLGMAAGGQAGGFSSPTALDSCAASPLSAVGSFDRPAGKAVYVGKPPARPRTLIDILAATATEWPSAAAIDDGERVLTYREVVGEVGAISALLTSRGIGWGDRVGVRIPSGTAELYLAILAVLSVGAAYVPVDVDDPDERAELVWAQAGVCAVIGPRRGVASRVVPARRVGPRRPRPVDDAWIIFTSGSTGTPKGVAVTHRSAAAFVDAEAGLFAREHPLGPDDRVLAGLSVAFDASCEEMWLAWRHGACLVPAPRSLVKAGAELGQWLVSRGVTVVSTVPTLAALWTERHLRGVRLLILGGEACPEQLATRLTTTCGEVWNTYGPTETTVVACGARLRPEGPVRIGVPLDGWRLAVVDPANGHLLEWGQVGELVIAGVGTARYLDRDKDAAGFVTLPELGWRRAYRSGDLVRAEPQGLVYVGRTDTQVKIRGYRIELSEIESVMARAPGIAHVVVNPYQTQPGNLELVGYYRRDSASIVDQQALARHLRAHLPPHMVPAYLEELAVIPTLTSGKVDRAHLPAPTSRCTLVDPRSHVRPSTAEETVLADVLADVAHLRQVSVDSHFFDDLGLQSLSLAHFRAGVHQRTQLPLSMRDIYRYPTVRSLAAALARRTAAAPRSGPSPPSAAGPRASSQQYVLCGALQLLVLLALVVLGAAVVTGGVRWLWSATDPVDLYARSVRLVAVVMTTLCVLPVLAKWVLIGRWTERDIAIWSLDYVCFWMVKTLTRMCPLVLFAGSPLYLMYLRALGAKIGRDVAIFSTTLPVCTDLLCVGDHTVIRKSCSFTGYRAEAGVIRTGTITVGRGVVVGESTFLDIDTTIEDHAVLDHASSLHQNQKIPTRQRWHGCPAQPASREGTFFPTASGGRLRRACYATGQLAYLLLGLPLIIAFAVAEARTTSWITTALPLGPAALTGADLYRQELRASFSMFVGGFTAGLVIVIILPRVLHRWLTPDQVYPLYGWAYLLERTIARITNAPFFVRLYGDSSYIVGYLAALGYRLVRAGQTGSNFGAEVTHESPYLVSIGAGTMISDGVRFSTAVFSATSFHVSPVSIGSRCFLGNRIVVPSGARLGDNCFVGTKTMIPSHGPAKKGVGLLGSPPFEIPRTTARNHEFPLSRIEFRHRLAAKNRYNACTIAVFMLTQWIRMHLAIMIGFAGVLLYSRLGLVAIALGAVAVIAADFAYSVLIERASTGFRELRPAYCSIYDSYFWRHERFWKLSVQPRLLNGTPFKAMAWRLLGAHIGRRVFDDGCGISEKALVQIGDDATIGDHAVLQSHSMEDGIFKADRIVVGARCTLGAGAFVHYGATMGDGARLATDSFLMKGEQVPADSHWHGNPAQHIQPQPDARPV